MAVVNGPTHSITFGEMPASSSATSTSTVPSKILTG